MGVFANNSEFTIKKSDATFHRDWFSCHGIVSAYEVGSLATSNFEAIFINVVAPSFSFRKIDWSCIDNPCMGAIGIDNFSIEDIFSSKPGIINKIVLLVAYPRRSEYFGHFATTLLLFLAGFDGSWHYEIFIGTCNGFNFDLVIVLITFTAIGIIVCCPENVDLLGIGA